MRNERLLILVIKPERNKSLGNLGINEGVSLKHIPNKRDMRMCTGLI
jgi:hypothetical protein